MGTSRTKRQRLKQVRAGKMDPTELRSVWTMNPLERKTDTLQAKRMKADRSQDYYQLEDEL